MTRPERSPVAGFTVRAAERRRRKPNPSGMQSRGVWLPRRHCATKTAGEPPSSRVIERKRDNTQRRTGRYQDSPVAVARESLDNPAAKTWRSLQSAEAGYAPWV